MIRGGQQGASCVDNLTGNNFIFSPQFFQLRFFFFNCFNFWMIRGGQQGGFQSCKVGRWQFDRWQFERRATIFRGMHLILPSMPIHRSMWTWITIARRVIDWLALLPVLGTQRWAKLSWRWPKIEIHRAMTALWRFLFSRNKPRAKLLKLTSTVTILAY